MPEFGSNGYVHVFEFVDYCVMKELGYCIK